MAGGAQDGGLPHRGKSCSISNSVFVVSAYESRLRHLIQRGEAGDDEVLLLQ